MLLKKLSWIKIQTLIYPSPLNSQFPKKNEKNHQPHSLKEAYQTINNDLSDYGSSQLSMRSRYQKITNLPRK